MTEFNPLAPSAPAVFYRSYSRRKEDGTRESFEEAITRTISAIAEIGSFDETQKELALEMGLKQHCFPSGRALWVAGTDWAKKPDNFPGYYNCCSMHVDNPSIFGLLMELAMMGTGTGAVLESDVASNLPPVRRSLFVTDVIKNEGVKGGLSDTFIQFTGIVDENPTILVRVGDSREGWASAYQGLIELAMGTPASDEDEATTCIDALITLDLSHVRQAGEPLKGFGGTANPVRLQESMERAATILSRAAGRKLTPIECCLLIDEAASAVVAGNIRRSAGMRQFSSEDIEAAMAKDGLYKQDADGNWSVDPDKEALRMANHTRCFHDKPSYEEIEHAVTKQFWSGEGAIMYVPESIARANADLLNTEKLKQQFLRTYIKSPEEARQMLVELSEKAGEPTDERIIQHRLDRYGLNPCFAPGTIVMTKGGYFPIEELVGKTVEVHDGNEWRAIDNFRVTAYDQDVYTVMLHNGVKIKATKYHKFILENGQRVELKDLKIGDRLMPAQTAPVEGTIDVKGAYLKGFLIGDGSSNKAGAPICKIYGPKEVCTQKLYAAQEEIGLVERRAQNGITVGVETGLTETGNLRNLTALKENLYNWSSVYKKQFPYETLNWTNQCKAEFIAGLFDADGTALDSLNGFGYQITSISRDFLEGLLVLLGTIGINGKIGPVRTGGLKDFGANRGGIYETKDIYRLAISQANSIELAKIVSFQRLKSFADRQTSYKVKNKSNVIASIEYSHKAPEVYCCTVPGSHAFTLGTLHLVAQCGEILMRDNLCNLSEIHLNTINPSDTELQHKAFYSGGLQVAALLQHKFVPERLAYSRENDPIVGVSFTGLFDFFVHAFGAPWLKWMMKGRPPGSDFKKYDAKEQKFLKSWRLSAEQGVKDYCQQHGIRLPNRFTTVQPAGSKSLLTGASSGWHPPKAQRFIRRITFGVNDPLVSALRDYGYPVIPAQSARDEAGNLLDDINDPRVREVLVEIPTEVSWANIPGCDEFDLSKLPVEAQWGLYIQVQNHYTTHNTSATLEFRENEIKQLSKLIHENIKADNGYISAALLARFDANETFPRLPFEPITKQIYERRMGAVIAARSILDPDTTVLDLLKKYDNPGYELKGAAGCDSAKCLVESEKDSDQTGKL